MCQIVDIYRRALFLPVFRDVFKGVFGAHIFAVVEPFFIGFEGAEALGEGREEFSKVGANGQVGFYERLFELGGIDVDYYFICALCKIFPVVANLPYIVSRAKKQHAV